jgi:hypothetical protein
LETSEFLTLVALCNKNNVQQFHHMVIESLRFQTIFKTQSGKLGIASHSIAVGDQVILYSGGRLPMVVRQQEQFYRLISPGYVHGIMRGEAWPKNEIDLQDFILA